MRPIRGFKIESVPHHAIALAATNEEPYSADRVLIAVDWPELADYTVISGSHCSCYGFDEVQWDAIVYTRNELRKVAQGWSGGFGSEAIIAPLLLNYLASL